MTAMLYVFRKLKLGSRYGIYSTFVCVSLVSFTSTLLLLLWIYYGYATHPASLHSKHSKVAKQFIADQVVSIPEAANGSSELAALESRLKRLEQEHRETYSRILSLRGVNVTLEEENPHGADGYRFQLEKLTTRDYLSNRSLLQCGDVNDINLYGKLGVGYSKVVRLGRYRGKQVAVKFVSGIVQDVVACLRRGNYRQPDDCFLYPNYKIMKEILLALQLEHPNLIKLLGFCVRSEVSNKAFQEQGVISVVEVGKTMHLEQIRNNWYWRKRFKIVRDIASLLDYLEHSPLGSLIITDCKLKQMYMVGDSIRLGDLDDMNSVEPDCETGISCYINGGGRNFDIPCIHGKCIGYNAKFNLNAFNEIIMSRLLEEPPEELEGTIFNLKERMDSLLITAKHIHHELDAILGDSKKQEDNWYRKSLKDKHI